MPCMNPTLSPPTTSMPSLREVLSGINVVIPLLLYPSLFSLLRDVENLLKDLEDRYTALMWNLFMIVFVLISSNSVRA